MRRRFVILLVLALALPSVAKAAGVETPDGRVDVTVTPEANEDGDGGRVRVSGNAGAVPVDNAVQGDASPEDGGPYLEVTNPPMYETAGTRGATREELYGPPTARAALGFGRLTAGIGEAGVLTNLAWPGPGSPDHVSYANVSRGVPDEGTPENQGAFGGLLLPAGEEVGGRRVVWFTPTAGWRVIRQQYAGPESGTLVTVLEHDTAPLGVTIRDVVHPTQDVLARHFEVTGAPAGSRLVHFANMDPTTSRVPRAPANVSGVTDFAGDFATTYDAGSGTMLHFRPYTADPAAATVALTGSPGTTNALHAVSRTFGTGVYVAIGGEQAPVEFQAGLETLGLVRAEAEGTPALDPYYDAADGSLSGSVAAVGRTAGALAWEGTTGTVYLSAAEDPAAAVDAIVDARTRGFEAIRGAADANWAAWLGRARLPGGADPQTIDVVKRALMLIRTAQDEDTGAIVANTTSQTPYKQDWLRDGAFFNYALLLAGYDEMVARHNDFYRRAQSAAGHWDPILCTDGAQCSAVFVFEIDAQAFGVWALWLEYELSDRDHADLARLRHNYGAIRAGAEVLYACQDPTNGLQCYASEDDHPDPTQGAQGASTVYLGLRSAADAARALGELDDAERWDTRAEELRSAARQHLCADTCQRGRGYMIWPGKVLTADSGRAAGHSAVGEHPALAATLDRMADRYPSWIAGSTPGAGDFFQYPMEPLFSLATTDWRAEEGHEQLLSDAVRWLTHEVVEPGVLHYAERIYHTPEEGDTTSYLHSVGFPHIWSGAETYIAAALIQGLRGCPPGIDAIGDATCVGDRRGRSRRGLLTPLPDPAVTVRSSPPTP